MFKIATSACIALAVSALLALSAKQPPPFGDSLTWETGKEAPSLDAMRGKSVLVVFFQDWCPICNKWSGEFFGQVGEAYANDPLVVLVAIKTDGGTTRDALAYLKDRTDTNRWLVAVDNNATYYRQATGANKLYTYMWVAPDGTVGEVAKAGEYFGGENNKRFSLATEETQTKVRKGAAPLMPVKPPFPNSLQPAVRMAESGLFLTALSELAKTSSDSALREDVARFRKQIATHLEASVECHSSAVADEKNENRYLAYLALRRIERDFGKSAPGQAAHKSASAQASSAWLSDEEAAFASYNSIMRRAARADDERAQSRIAKSLEKLAGEYPNTLYGSIAASSAKN
jgi:hypothetical protein